MVTKKENTLSECNSIAWNTNSYAAWVCKYGKPQAAARKLKQDPTRKLKTIYQHIADRVPRKIINPLGSHGSVAVSLSLLGAEVCVIDFSTENKRYAVELAKAAEVNIRYEVGEFLHVAAHHCDRYNLAIMELGIVHYFSDLQLFTSAIYDLLVPGSQMILHEFHPLLKKSIEQTEYGIGLKGDYFKSMVEDACTPYEELVAGSAIPLCNIRRWNLGEIVTAFAKNGFRVESLTEEPDTHISQLPGTFTLVCKRD